MRRLGYAVTRTKAPNPEYPLPPPFGSAVQRWSGASIFAGLAHLLQQASQRLFNFFAPRFNWWRPIRLNCLWPIDSRKMFPARHRACVLCLSLGGLFRHLRFLPGGHDTPLRITASPKDSTSPYEIFYNVYKPSTSFKKTSPPPPDYSIVVVKYID